VIAQVIQVFVGVDSTGSKRQRADVDSDWMVSRGVVIPQGAALNETKCRILYIDRISLQSPGAPACVITRDPGNKKADRFP